MASSIERRKAAAQEATKQADQLLIAAATSRFATDATSYRVALRQRRTLEGRVSPSKRAQQPGSPGSPGAQAGSPTRARRPATFTSIEEYGSICQYCSHGKRDWCPIHGFRVVKTHSQLPTLADFQRKEAARRAQRGKKKGSRGGGLGSGGGFGSSGYGARGGGGGRPPAWAAGTRRRTGAGARATGGMSGAALGAAAADAAASTASPTARAIKAVGASGGAAASAFKARAQAAAAKRAKREKLFADLGITAGGASLAGGAGGAGSSGGGGSSSGGGGGGGARGGGRGGDRGGYGRGRRARPSTFSDVRAAARQEAMRNVLERGVTVGAAGNLHASRVLKMLRRAGLAQDGGAGQALGRAAQEAIASRNKHAAAAAQQQQGKGKQGGREPSTKRRRSHTLSLSSLMGFRRKPKPKKADAAALAPSASAAGLGGGGGGATAAGGGKATMPKSTRRKSLTSMLRSTTGDALKLAGKVKAGLADKKTGNRF